VSSGTTPSILYDLGVEVQAANMNAVNNKKATDLFILFLILKFLANERKIFIIHTFASSKI